jgi:hypothetical protein
MNAISDEESDGPKFLRLALSFLISATIFAAICGALVFVSYHLEQGIGIAVQQSHEHLDFQ